MNTTTIPCSPAERIRRRFGHFLHAAELAGLIVIGLATGQTVVLGLRPADMVLLTLTLLVSTLTFTSARTNVLLGAVHLVLFTAYLALVFDAGA